nr:hypothetical transcript [Hymenolepis microstoma]
MARPVFRFRSFSTLKSINEYATLSLKIILDEHSVVLLTDESFQVDGKVLVEFTRKSSEECEYVVSFNSEDSDLGINVCSVMAQHFDIY